jgi:hypothetical protein
VGDGDGDPVGDGDGEGEPVGDGDGDPVGVGVGDGAGVWVGAGDGEAVGAGGEAVGAGVAVVLAAAPGPPRTTRAEAKAATNAPASTPAGPRGRRTRAAVKRR